MKLADKIRKDTRKMTFARKVCLSEFVVLSSTHCIVKLGPDDGRRFGQTLREMKAARSKLRRSL